MLKELASIFDLVHGPVHFEYSQIIEAPLNSLNNIYSIEYKLTVIKNLPYKGFSKSARVTYTVCWHCSKFDP